MRPLNASAIHLPRRQPGFSLVELALVMLIVSLLLAGILVPLSIQREVRDYGETKRKMDQINEALMGFVLVNGRLPCPASATVADGTAGAGTELLAVNVCTSYIGVIPWVTLNVPETDEWGGRFTYKVNSVFADAIAAATYGCVPTINPTQSSFALCSSGDMSIQSRTPAPAKAQYALTNTTLPAVFISHGKNGKGAYRTNGTQIALPPVASGDERANATTTTTAFFSREKQEVSSPCDETPLSAGPMCEFDDLVAYVPLTMLLTRMVASNKFPELR